VRLAVLHPGEMGVSVGAALRASGHEVYWLPPGRSRLTAARAASAGLRSCASLPELVATVQGIVSVCPPHGALALAESVVAAGFRGTYVDANAISPETARGIETLVGAGFVDGGIIGPPVQKHGSTRMYVSGAAAAEVTRWFAGGALGVSAIAGGAGAASALKMCYAAYTKGTGALLLAIRAVAQAEGVTDALLGEWALSQPGLAQRSESLALASASKAWRFVGEMQEISRTFRSAGLPGGFHEGAAEVYGRLQALQENTDVTLADVLAALHG